MTTAFTGGMCWDGQRTDQDRLFYCNISIASGSAFSVISLENARRSNLFLERGKILVNMGETDSAKDDFSYALIAAARGKQIVFPDVLREPHVAKLFAVMQLEPEQSVAYELWLVAIIELACVDDAKVAARNAICARS